MWFKYVPADSYGRGLHSILVALKVKQTPKLIALPLSDTQVGTETNKQTNKSKRNYIIYKLLTINYIFFAASHFHLMRDHYMQFPA